MKVYVVHAQSESCDHYFAAFKEKPTTKEALEKMHILEEFEVEDDDEVLTGHVDIVECELK